MKKKKKGGTSPMQQQHRRRGGAIAEPAAVAVTGGKPEDKTHSVLAMVIDRSGSMSTMGSELQGGCNTYLAEQRRTDAEDGSRTTMIVTTFDHSVELLHEDVQLTAVPDITEVQVSPRGTTALYDAIGTTMTRAAALVNALNHKPNVTIFILTDGQENASQQWTKARVNADISRLQTEQGWDFFFAAANQDAMAEGSALGMDMDQCMTYGSSGTKMSSAMRSAQAAQCRKKRGFSPKFSPAERAQCA